MCLSRSVQAAKTLTLVVLAGGVGRSAWAIALAAVEDGSMWRSFFVAIGVTLIILGAESMLVDQAVLSEQFATRIAKVAKPKKKKVDEFGIEIESPSAVGATRSFTPPDWAPWSLISAGTVVLLYAMTLKSGEGG